MHKAQKLETISTNFWSSFIADRQIDTRCWSYNRLKTIRAECGIYPHSRISSAALQRAIFFRGDGDKVSAK